MKEKRKREAEDTSREIDLVALAERIVRYGSMEEPRREEEKGEGEKRKASVAPLFSLFMGVFFVLLTLVILLLI